MADTPSIAFGLLFVASCPVAALSNYRTGAALAHARAAARAALAGSL